MDVTPKPVALSVVVCAHNPRSDFWQAMLGGLRNQSLEFAQWELLIVDNSSEPALRVGEDLQWHPHVRLLREPQLGLTHARLRGIAEARGPLLVFVDDDNLLRDDYLKVALNIARSRPHLGAWGGNICLKFAEPPPDWTRPHWFRLAKRTVPEEKLSTSPFDWPSMPYGAGLCVRREVAAAYREKIAGTWRMQLDRCGPVLLCAGDLDLACTACDLGLAKGVLPELSLDHLIPPSRLTESYLRRLIFGAEVSNFLLRWARDPDFPPPRLSLRRLRRYAKWMLKHHGRERGFRKVMIHAERVAVAIHGTLLSGGGAQTQSNEDLKSAWAKLWTRQAP